MQGQCSLSSATDVPDNAIFTIDLSVSGLIDNSLSSPTQGICGVEIDFMHEYLGDLTITLISPSGTSVDLIGPATTSTGNTNLTRWNIEFVPCMTPASPDAGFADIWSNLQSWNAVTPYSGSYHPHVGCLEDFNAGPANGIWQVVIQDHGEFQLGSIASFTLIFCNPTGLDCTECNPNAGTISPSAFNLCSGENIQSSDITVDFGTNIPSPTDYAYEYLLLSGNTILQSGTNFSITPPAGSYMLCGMSYLLSDAAVINTLIAGDDYATLSQAIDNGVACAQLTSSCIMVEVRAKPDSVFIDTDLCNGEVFTYRGQDYTSDGIYYQLLDGPGLCDTVIEIRISARTLSVMLNIPDTLSCGSGSVSLQAMVSGSSGPYSYQWSTTEGNITSPTNNNSISADQAGQYFVLISDGVCEGSGSAIVVADQGFPQVFFGGGTISCDRPVININPIYIPSDGNILWTGPSGFVSTQPNIAITVPGTYVLSVTNAAGCITARSVDIGIDTSTTPIDIIVIGKDCQNNLLALGNTFPERLRGWQWTGPNGFVSNYWRPEITDAGIYTLTGTFYNGCTRAGSFLFDGDFAIPDLTISPDDTLNCNEVLLLSISSSISGVSYAWSGPQGFSSNLAIIEGNQKGDYFGSVTAPNGCRNTGSVSVEIGDDIFDYTIFSDTLTCAMTMVTIGVFTADADLFDWVNYSGPDDDENSIQVATGGNYQVMMTDTNTGCVVIAEIFVPTNYAYTHFGYTTDTISCTNPIAELNFVPIPGVTYSSVHWELPDLTVVQGPTLMSDLPGQHRLLATGVNGCIGEWRIHIPFDTIRPLVFLETDTLNCEDTIQIVAQSLDSIVSYQWNGPGILIPGDDFIEVDEPGWYHLSAFGLNGCPAEHDIFVDSNFVLPSFNLTIDSLRCDQPALFTAISADEVLSYSWFDQAGVLISSDSFVNVTLPGVYTFELKGVNQCVACDTVILFAPVFPFIALASDTFTCSETIVPVSVQIDIAQYTLAWLNLNGDTIDQSSTINVTASGPFIASVSGLNACTTIDTIQVPFDTIPPVARIEDIGEIRCKSRDVMLDASGSFPAPLLFTWTTSGGNILSNPSLTLIDVRDTGLYILEVVQVDNGCTDSDSILLTEHPDALRDVFFDISLPACSGDNNASITITELVGGVAPIQYQLNGGVVQSNPVFEGLEAGTYFLSLTDAENCVFDTTITIVATISFSVDAGPDLEIHLGESVEILGMTDLPPDDILSDQWDSLGLTLCVDCALFDVSPLETNTYSYQLTSVTGCVLSDEVIVYVIEKGKYYIANIFSPNGDGINDEIRLNPSPGIDKVLHWVIFDRWGNAVYGKTDFDPGDPSVFWNGQTTTGDYPNPGVFPYVLEIQLINGKTEVYHGEITLLR